MPVVDMPLEKLKEYQGKNPRPADFDEFWDRSLAEMNAIDPKPVFTPYPMQSKIADCFELRFTSTKGATVYAKFVRPKNIEGKIPAVLNFHGLSGCSCQWNSLLGIRFTGLLHRISGLPRTRRSFAGRRRSDRYDLLHALFQRFGRRARGSALPRSVFGYRDARTHHHGA